MTRTLTIRKKEVLVEEDTPIPAVALLAFFNISRSSFYDDVKRGYEMEFGSLTTPKHYRSWLRANPRPKRKPRETTKQAETLRLERELSQAR